MTSPLTVEQGAALLDRVRQSVAQYVVGQEATVHDALVAYLARGHVLVEGVPGTAKTLLVRALAAALGLRFSRIQFTPDLMPSDVTGVNVLRDPVKGFEFQPGPVFTDLLLGDEINRAPAKTQSALLEAMAESQVSVDGTSAPLPELFFVIATQNPVEFRGTYPLPEAQMDRFAMQFGLGYVEPAQEIAILTDQAERHPLEALSACVSLHEVLALRQGVRQVRVTDEVKRYAVDLVRATRTAIGVQLGASPRASLALVGAAQAVALFDGQAFVSPEHVQELAVPVIAHRLALDPQARFSGTTAVSVVEEVVKTIAVPA